MRRLVLLGAGHAHIEVLRDLAARHDARLQVTLVSPYPWLTYTGMVPGHIAGHYALDECTIPLGPLVQAAGAELRLTTASLVSPDANEVVLSDGNVLKYDVLSLDVGSQPRIGNAAGVDRHAIVARPLERLLKGWNDVYARAARERLNAVTVVGGGAGGVELALAMNHRLRSTLDDHMTKVRLISDASGIGLKAGAVRKLARRLRRAEIDIHLGSAVVEVGAGYVRLESGLDFATGATFWVTGASPPGWIRDSGLATDPGGFLLTSAALQSRSHPRVFGAGDCAIIDGRPLPRAGVFAVRAGPILAANLRAAIEGAPLVHFGTGRRYLALISTGDRHAVGVWGGISFQGRWTWRWKDRIDRRFVARYRPAG